LLLDFVFVGKDKFRHGLGGLMGVHMATRPPILSLSGELTQETWMVCPVVESWFCRPGWGLVLFHGRVLGFQ
jgi:hypothetical protein